MAQWLSLILTLIVLVTGVVLNRWHVQDEYHHDRIHHLHPAVGRLSKVLSIVGVLALVAVVVLLFR